MWAINTLQPIADELKGNIQIVGQYNHISFSFSIDKSLHFFRLI